MFCTCDLTALTYVCNRCLLALKCDILLIRILLPAPGISILLPPLPLPLPPLPLLTPPLPLLTPPLETKDHSTYFLNFYEFVSKITSHHVFAFDLSVCLSMVVLNICVGKCDLSTS